MGASLASGATFHGVADEGVPTRDIADVIGRRLKVPVVSKSLEEAAAHFGWLARFFVLDIAASSARTQQHSGGARDSPGSSRISADAQQHPGKREPGDRAEHDDQC